MTSNPGDYFTEVVDALWQLYRLTQKPAAALIKAKYLAASYPVTIHALSHLPPESVATHLLALDAGSTDAYLETALRQLTLEPINA